MALRIKARHWPSRLAAGAFILLATNAWLLGIGVGFIVEELTERIADHARTEERQQPCP